MEFDYFYGPEDAEQYQFYRIPKLLITSERFKDVSVESKLLYGLMLDRLSLSIKNGWFDSLNRAYIIYTVEDVMEDMHCGNQKAIKLIAELEKEGVDSSMMEKMLTPRGIKMTVTMISVIPIMCVYPFMQRFLVKGIMIGAVKG